MQALDKFPSGQIIVLFRSEDGSSLRVRTGAVIAGANGSGELLIRDLKKI